MRRSPRAAEEESDETNSSSSLNKGIDGSEPQTDMNIKREDIVADTETAIENGSGKAEASTNQEREPTSDVETTKVETTGGIDEKSAEVADATTTTTSATINPAAIVATEEKTEEDTTTNQSQNHDRKISCDSAGAETSPKDGNAVSGAETGEHKNTDRGSRTPLVNSTETLKETIKPVNGKRPLEEEDSVVLQARRALEMFQKEMEGTGDDATSSNAKNDTGGTGDRDTKRLKLSEHHQRLREARFLWKPIHIVQQDDPCWL